MQTKNAKLEDLNASKICVLPWTSLVAGPEANFAICCEMVPSEIPTNVSTSLPLDQIVKVDSKVLRIKDQMLAGKEPAECNNCFSREKLGFKSTRHYYNERFFMLRESFDFDDSPPTFLELRLGNLCQLECVMCNPSRSEKLEKLFNELGSVDTSNSFLKIKSISSSWLESKTLIDKFIELCKEVKVIYFNGGEPLLVKMHNEILSRLIAEGVSQDIRLTYSTNGLLLNQSHIDTWRKFKRINITISIDDLYERNRFIRYPSNWQKVIDCLEIAKQNFDDQLNFNIWSTINILNFYYVDELESFFREGYKFNHQIRGIQEPRFLSPINIPKRIKTKIANKLKSSVQNKNVLSEIDFIESSNGDDALFYQGLEYMERVAEKRNIDIKKTFKEFYELINE